MAQQKDIVSELQLVIKGGQAKVTENNSKLFAANELYNKLLKDGVIKKRGFTLRGIEDYKLIRHTVANQRYKF